MAKVKIKIIKEIDAESIFNEIDRTDLVIGVGEVYGRDGSYPRTDLGTFTFSTKGETFGVIFLESDGSLNCQYESAENCKSMVDALKPEAEKVYKHLIDTKYKPLFEKYGLKGFEDVIKLNMAREGIKQYILNKWKPGEIIIRKESDPRKLQGGVQNGNLGLFIHKYDVDKPRSFNAQPTYYIDFPEKIFVPNNFGGSQSPEEIKQYGKKMWSPKSYRFEKRDERENFISAAYDNFIMGKLIGFE